jgi:hypothetical protein
MRGYEINETRTTNNHSNTLKTITRANINKRKRFRIPKTVSFGGGAGKRKIGVGDDARSGSLTEIQGINYNIDQVPSTKKYRTFSILYNTTSHLESLPGF